MTLRATAYKIKTRIKRFFSKPPFRPKYRTMGNYWVQELDFQRYDLRMEYFLELCKGKKVLHFGCTDWPIFKPHQNLHIQLAPHTELLHGFDIDIQGIENLKKYVDQAYFTHVDQLGDTQYDVCIIPETIEHVDNVSQFLGSLEHVNAEKFVITAPNCFSPEVMKRNYLKTNSFIEVVHPDHNYWFSPYTLNNVIRKYSKLEVSRTVLLAKDTMVSCEAVKRTE